MEKEYYIKLRHGADTEETYEIVDNPEDILNSKGAIKIMDTKADLLYGIQVGEQAEEDFILYKIKCSGDPNIEIPKYIQNAVEKSIECITRYDADYVELPEKFFKKYINLSKFKIIKVIEISKYHHCPKYNKYMLYRVDPIFKYDFCHFDPINENSKPQLFKIDATCPYTSGMILDILPMTSENIRNMIAADGSIPSELIDKYNDVKREISVDLEKIKLSNIAVKRNTEYLNIIKDAVGSEGTLYLELSEEDKN